MIDLVLNTLLITCTPTPQAKLVPINTISAPLPPSVGDSEIDRRATTWGELMQTNVKQQLSSLQINLRPEHIVYVMKRQYVVDDDFREENGFFYPTSKKTFTYYFVFDAETGKPLGQYK